MGTPHIRHFAAQASERRRRLGMTFADVNQNVGPTAPTLAKAEAGALIDPRPSTLSKFRRRPAMDARLGRRDLLGRR